MNHLDVAYYKNSSFIKSMFGIPVALLLGEEPKLAVLNELAFRTLSAVFRGLSDTFVKLHSCPSDIAEKPCFEITKETFENTLKGLPIFTNLAGFITARAILRNRGSSLDFSREVCYFLIDTAYVVYLTIVEEKLISIEAAMGG